MTTKTKKKSKPVNRIKTVEESLDSENGHDAKEPENTVETEVANEGDTPPGPTAEEKAAAEKQAQDAYDQGVIDRQAEVAESALEEATLKKQHKRAKERFDSAVEDLQWFVDKGVEHLPLFDGQKEPDPLADLAWRTTAIATLEISDTLVGKLLEAGIENIGQLADYTAAGKQLCDLKGIGPQKVEQIEEAMTKFWASRPEVIDTAVVTVGATGEKITPAEMGERIEEFFANPQIAGEE